MIKLGILKRLNYPLIIGSIFLLILFVTSVYPDLLATADPYGKQRLEFNSSGTGETSFMVPPVKPSKEYPWGTDHLGRDVKSLIIYGCKVTMAMAVFSALGRLLIALPLAISAAYKNKVSIWFIKQFNIIFSAFPLIVVVIILSSMQLFVDILKDEKLIVALLLIIFGWSKLSYILMQKANEILSQEFIEGEIAIGKSRLEIALQNVLPHLIPTLIMLFFLEVALVLQTMAQIGIFGMIAGGGYYNAEGEINVPFAFDWSSLLVFTYMFFGTDKMYLVIFPAAAFAFSIIGFNLFGEGLRIEFEKRTSRVITVIRRIPSYISPFRLIYEINNFSKFKRTVYTKIICYTLVLAIVFFPQAPSLYKFNAEEAFNNIETLSSDKYMGRLAGTPENKEIAEYIKTEMESYGLKPFDGQYIHEFEIARSINIKNAKLKVVNSISGDKEFEFRKDYYVTSPINFSGEFEVVKLDVNVLYEMNQVQREALIASGFDNKLVMINIYGNMDFKVLNTVLQFIVLKVKPRAIIFLDGWEVEGTASKHVIINKVFTNTAVISVSKDTGDELQRLGNSKIQVSVEADVYKNKKGYNVMGYIPGTDENLKNESIVIGSNFDYLGDDTKLRYPGALEAGGVAAQLEIAKELAASGIKPKQDIIFAFWDGSYNENRGSSYFAKKYVAPGKMEKVTYIDIGNLAIKKEKTLLMDTSRIFPKNKNAQTYIKILKDNARRQGINLDYGSVNSPVMLDLNSKVIQSLMISNTDKDRISTTSKETIDMLDKKRYKKIGQMLLDTIIGIARDK
jgi:peptide/nickel transport system permease protein